MSGILDDAVPDLNDAPEGSCIIRIDIRNKGGIASAALLCQVDSDWQRSHHKLQAVLKITQAAQALISHMTDHMEDIRPNKVYEERLQVSTFPAMESNN